MRRSLLPSLAMCAALIAACERPPENVQTVDHPVVSLPENPREGCPKSRARYYGECLDQSALFDQALALGRAQNKTVLVEIGAEWCVWCHLLHRHLIGETFSRFSFTYRNGEEHESREPESEADQQAAQALGQYVAANFVLVHIDLDNKFEVQPETGTGWAVMEAAGARGLFADWVPFTFIVDQEGTLLEAFNTRSAEKKDDARKYRGYDRRALLSEAQRVRALALESAESTQ